MGDALERLYDQNLGFRTLLPMNESLNQISKLRWELAQWQDNLPHWLQIITSHEPLVDVPMTVGSTRFRVLLSLRFLGAKILVLRPILCQFLELSNTTTPNERQSEWLWESGAILLADLGRTCSDILQISKTILAGAKNDQNLLGAWWFSCYYTFNSSLAVLGILLINRIPAYSGQSPIVSVPELRGLLDTAMDILHGLNKGNETIMRCRDTLTRLITAFESNGDIAEFVPASFSLSPSSAWAWQLVNPGLFSFEESSSLAPGTVDVPSSSQLPISTNLEERPQDDMFDVRLPFEGR
ncbi:hypothetical protein N7513_006489 [Penicillium frequentans]|nr:hypothetical protein N7513_006489 [Penicillium glabrum]